MKNQNMILIFYNKKYQFDISQLMQFILKVYFKF